MPKQKSPERLRALQLYIESDGKNSIHLIAQEVGATESTVRGWKVKDDWPKALRVAKRSVKEAERSATAPIQSISAGKRKSGGQPGNLNAVGNKGGRGNPAPKGNKYAVTTGEFETILFDSLTDAQKRLIETAPESHAEKLLAEYHVAIVRERNILMNIQSVQRKKERDMVPARVNIKSSTAGSGGTITRDTFTTHESADDRLIRLEDALTRVQNYIRSVVSDMHRFEVDDARIEIERKKAHMDAATGTDFAQYVTDAYGLCKEGSADA